MTRQRGRTSRQADIAKEAGVSQSTVSMVLNGTAENGRISAETRKRVLSTARRLQYVPASAQRAPAVRAQALLLGVHTFEPIFPTSTGDYYFEFMRGIEDQAAAESCNLMLFTAARNDSGVRRIYEDGVNGLAQAAGSLLLGHHADRDDLERLAAEEYPFVYIGHREVADGIAYVGGDYRTATGRIVDELVGMGHRSFAYLGETSRHEPQVDRWEGFATALGRFGLAVPEPTYVDPEGLTAQWLDDAVAAGATALLVESVSLLRVLAAMASIRGLEIPRDLSIVVLVDIPVGEVGTRQWASLRVPRHEMGRRAVRLLTGLLTDPAGDHERQVLLPCTYSLEGTARSL
ncbi:LacI family DNA-binding transcriptional regulator [Glycomyces harbinensis]|uniref:DNA-binding transcriptional regulator, LacI/PurR family n=1 Tax=Glycomyces harbinensis TaxID=58114 RepID=A0A1G6WWS3_9ACTN|nr:LacI family DNA-binding transcriptional regulator [Glycomyces harbinensis]SDD70342.1 DNA-binding transcriptional regulator, LacI/PurR family [Glycomyces harbinensis]